MADRSAGEEGDILSQLGAILAAFGVVDLVSV